MMNRILSASQLGYATQRLREKLDFTHIRYSSVVSAYSSQQCAKCGFVDSKNRPNQATFKCVACGHTDNADANASKVIAKRFGDTELSGVADYRDVKAVLLKRFYDRFPDARSVSGGLEPLAHNQSKDNRKVTVNQPTLTPFL
jgi:putative transposase